MTNICVLSRSRSGTACAWLCLAARSFALGCAWPSGVLRHVNLRYFALGGYFGACGPLILRGFGFGRAFAFVCPRTGTGLEALSVELDAPGRAQLCASHDET